MAGKSDIRAGGAFVELFTKDAALVKGLRSAQKRLEGFGKSVMAVGGFFTGLGGAMLAPLAGAVAHFTSAGSQLNDLSERTGLAASNLAELKYAAEQSGAGLEDVEKAMRHMAKSGTSETFDHAAARISAIKDPTDRARAAMERFGKSGTTLLPMLATLQEARREARELGLVPTDEAVKSADALGDAFDQVKSVVGAAMFEIGAAMAPVLMPLATTVRNVVVGFNHWVRENGQLIRTVAMVGAGLVAAGVVITGVGVAIFGLGAAAGVAATVLTTIGAVIGAIVSPIGLVTIGLAAAAVAFFRFTETGRAAVTSLMEFLGPVIETVRTTIGGIADALMAGDLTLAANIAMAGVRIAFEAGKLQILATWFDLKLRVLAAIDEIGVALAPSIAYIGSLWQSLTDYVGTLFGVMAAGANPFWEGMSQAGSIVILGLSKLFEQLLSIVQTFFSIVGIGLKATLAQAAAIANVAVPVINAGIKQETGFDILDTLKRADDAAAAAGGQARADADARQQGRRDNADGKLDEQRERMAAAQAELERLRKEAAAAREAAQAVGTGPKGVKPPDGMAAASSATVTFSGAALMAAGQGGGTQDMARDIREQLKTQRKQEKLLEKIADKEGAVAS